MVRLSQSGSQMANTQESSMQSQQSQAVTPEELKDIVNDIVLFVLIQGKTKYPVKRQDIVKHALKNHSRLFRKVMQDVQKVLKEVFGLSLVDVDNGKVYLLINQLQNSDDMPHVSFEGEEKSKMVLLTIVLSIIFMSGRPVKEESLMSSLSKMEIIAENNSTHKYFRDARSIIRQEFVRQMYLEYNRIPDSDPPKFEYQWGKRAELEVSRRGILKFVCTIYGNCKPSDWVAQYAEAEKSEGEASTSA